jgi:hypothetical protein
MDTAGKSPHLLSREASHSEIYGARMLPTVFQTGQLSDTSYRTLSRREWDPRSSQERYMQTVTDSFSHVLLFACPQCGSPLASASVSTEKNLEVTEARWANPRCDCGWTGSVVGVQALKHWVEPWKIPVDVAPEEDDHSGWLRTNWLNYCRP